MSGDAVAQEEVEVELRLTRDELTEETAAESGLSLGTEEPIAAEGGGLEEARFVETVAVVAVGTLSVIAIRMVNHWLRKDEEGVQIDLRETPPVISTVANVPQGYVVILEPDGTVTTERAEYDDPEDLVPLLSRFLAT